MGGREGGGGGRKKSESIFDYSDDLWSCDSATAKRASTEVKERCHQLLDAVVKPRYAPSADNRDEDTFSILFPNRYINDLPYFIGVTAIFSPNREKKREN